MSETNATHGEDALPYIPAERKQGPERFRAGGRDMGFDLLDFWQWSASDLVSNASRGVLAEYLVGRAVGASLVVRDEWALYDLETPDGIKIEVKSAAYIQAWRQEQLSPIQFSCRKARGWDAKTGREEGEPCRHADVYVFAFLRHTRQDTLDPMNLEQWEFFAVPTAWLDVRTRSQHSITLNSLARSFSAIAYTELGAAVRRAAGGGIIQP